MTESELIERVAEGLALSVAGLRWHEVADRASDVDLAINETGLGRGDWRDGAYMILDYVRTGMSAIDERINAAERAESV